MIENAEAVQENIPTEEEAAEAVQAACSQDAELMAALIEARLKLALLLGGASKEKLEEAARLAMVQVAAGAEPEEAAQKLLAECPYLRLAEREIPVFAAESKGSSDGFAAIKSIFARR